MHKEKILAGIWNSLTEYEYYFSIHALTHTIKIGKDLFFFFFLARKKQEHQSKINAIEASQWMFCRNNSKGDFFAVSNLLCSCITYPLGICDICDISDISWVVFFSTEDKIKLFYRESVQVERMKNKKNKQCQSTLKDWLSERGSSIYLTLNAETDVFL